METMADRVRRVRETIAEAAVSCGRKPEEICLVAASKTMGAEAVLWVGLGGVLYSIGVIFYAMKRVKWMHVVWHLFVLAGTLVQYFVVLFQIVLRKA